MGKCEKTPDKITIYCDCNKYVHTLTKDDSGEPQYNSAMVKAKKEEEGKVEEEEKKVKAPVEKKKKQSWLFRDINDTGESEE
jgi:hypothetical protein